MMGMESADAHTIKVLVLGDAGTGKTSFIKRYVHNFFSGHHRTTVGVDFHLKQLVIDRSNSKSLSGDENSGASSSSSGQCTTVRLQLWDIAGQDRFGAIARVYYKDAFGAILVYDYAQPRSFESVLKWKGEIDAKVVLPDGSPLPVLLLCNKIDLSPDREEELPRLREQLDAFCKREGFIGWFDTSAKMNINIPHASQFLVEHILNEHEPLLRNKKLQQQQQQVEGAGADARGTRLVANQGAGHNAESSRASGCC